jgi:hypothetical protein
MTQKWTMQREPEDFSGLTEIAPDECVYGLGPDFGTPGVIHLRTDRSSVRRTRRALTGWGVDPAQVRVIEWPGRAESHVAAAIAPVVQRLSTFRWSRKPGARWFPLHPDGPHVVEIADGPDAARLSRHMQDVALVVVGYLALPLLSDLSGE